MEKKSPAILKISFLLHLEKQDLTVDHFHNIKSQIITERTEGRPVHESNLAIGPEREFGAFTSIDVGKRC